MSKETTVRTFQVCFAGVLLAFLLYSILFWLTPMFYNKKFLSYAASLYHLGIVITVVAIVFDLILRQKMIQEEKGRARIHSAEKGFIRIEDIFRKMDPYLARMYKEMNPQQSDSFPLSHEQDLDPDREKRLEVHMANIIFQEIENVLETNQFGLHNHQYHQEWIRTWKTWFQSPILQSIWQENKNIFYSPQMVEFVDRKILGWQEIQIERQKEF